ncbi:N-acetylglucosaminyl deacetylase, LmbE family [Enhydrobacter aerosaccus]|uniref:N-acetylglucosaminyl deacetylase, LmbE family n=1 Tax=Enhydrobacter aerosaccus TaxID=225324 RepID=A0A1T4TA81_9HYPH|nr:PIG-L family deacetylase [Enhydrobacter aerosaccus]SKA37231.1 N-acetylglucosaminyl deacetylase, LmbE family [Enhydrobacter aerosaccus]
MKVRLFFAPARAVALLGTFALLLCAATVFLAQPLCLFLLPFAAFYLGLFALSAWALGRIIALEHWMDWDKPHRLLILAPHEDDCVIAAGGIGIRNHALGGATRIVYLAPDPLPTMAATRAEEARAAWGNGGVAPASLMHLDLLPPLRQRDPHRLRLAATRLRSIIDEFSPTVLVMPMFEGGHIHHDMVVGLIGSIVTAEDRFEIFEAPEYSPYVSLQYTPHRVIALCTRWLLGLVSYYGPPDGIDGRPVLKVRLRPDEIERKRGMLGAFVSQNAGSLMETRCYPDRLVRWDRTRRHRRPFEFRVSYAAFALAAQRLLPAALVGRLLPGERGTIGRDGSVTDLDDEFGTGPDRGQ